MDDIDHAALAKPAAGWDTTDNYSASHPLNAIHQLHTGIPGDPHRRQLGSTRREPRHPISPGQMPHNRVIARKVPL